MADHSADPRLVTVLGALATTGSLLSEDERSDLASRIVHALDEHHPPPKKDLAEKVGCAVGAVTAIGFSALALAAGAIGVAWLWQAVL